MGARLNPAARHFGRYELLEYLGSGGMSDVFVALHSGLRRRIALKLLRSSLQRDREAVARFLREGECAARVSHPNVVDVLDVGVEQGIPYLVMELLQGETLEQKLERDGPFGLSAAVDLVLPIFDGVAATHGAGVVHRDIKPANIVLARMPDGRVVPKLVDFGIATLEERRGITGALGPIGTPHYMSPEQARGARDVDERSDQYSLASMLYEMLVGQEPFGAGDVATVMERVARGKFPRVRAARSELPLAFEAVMARATAYDPAERFPSASVFAEALLPFASERTRKLWVGRNARQGVLGAQLLSGSYRPDSLPGEVTQITPVLGRRPKPSEPKHYSPMFIAVTCGMLMLGMGIGHLRSRGAAEPELPESNAEPVAASLPARAAAELRRFYVTPADATVMLDGVVIGRGDFTLPALDDGDVHELRVTAHGYVPRVVLFRRKLDLAQLALKPLELAAR